MPAEKKLVLAYSGGLDTSVAIRWLKDQGWDVIAFTVDLGEKKDLDAIQARALKIGASAAYVADGRAPFLQLFVWPSLQAGAVYEKEYPLATALGRPLIAAMMVEVARREGATAIAHGCTGKGNDQVRFDVATAALAPELTVVAPVREWGKNRDDEIEYATKHGIEVPATVLLLQSHQALEDITLPKEVARFKDLVAQQWAQMVYDGLWFSPLRDALYAFVAETQRHVTGEVRVKLFKGSSHVVGRKGPAQLYQLSLATYGKGDVFDQSAAEGFIKLWGMGVRTAARVQGRLHDREMKGLLGDVKRLTP
jgi:argininosuccinate synthase